MTDEHRLSVNPFDGFGKLDERRDKGRDLGEVEVAVGHGRPTSFACCGSAICQPTAVGIAASRRMRLAAGTMNPGPQGTFEMSGVGELDAGDCAVLFEEAADPGERLYVVVQIDAAVGGAAPAAQWPTRGT